MEIAADGWHQIVLGAGVEQLARNGWPVVAEVVRFEAVHASGDQRREVLTPVLAIELERMRPGGEAAHLVNQAHGFGWLEAEAFEVGRPVAADEAIEGFLDGLHVACLEQRLSHVWTSHAALTSDFEDALQVDWRTQFRQSVDHLFGACESGVAKLSDLILETRVLVVEEQAQDVDGDAGQVGTELDTGDDAQMRLSATNSDLDRQISDLERRLTQQRELLTNSFISMESAQSRIQQQSSAISNAFGAGSS